MDQVLYYQTNPTQCIEHPSFQCIFFDLMKEEKRRKLCIQCKSEYCISDECMHCILNHINLTEGEINIDDLFSRNYEFNHFFSHLKIIPDKMVDEIEGFFYEVQTVLINKIQEAKKSALIKAAQISLKRTALEKCYSDLISNFQKFQTILLRSSEAEFNKLIQEKYECQDMMICQLRRDIEQYQRSFRTFNLEIQMKKIVNISKLISNINCFSASPEPSSSLLQEVKLLPNQSNTQSFLALPLQNHENYIIRLKIIKFQETKIFLMKSRDDIGTLIFNSNASISSIKLLDHIKKIANFEDYELEMRINLKKKYIAIADYPLFQQVLLSKTTFESSVYYLQFHQYLNDQISVTEVLKVPEFDLKIEDE